MLKASYSLKQDFTSEQLEITILPHRQCTLMETKFVQAFDQFNSMGRGFVIAGFRIAGMLLSSVLYELHRYRPRVLQIRTKNQRGLEP
jgi:hypothetical protein